MARRSRSEWELDAPTEVLGPHPPRWHAGADVALLVLRLVLARAVLGRGAEVIFAGGPAPPLERVTGLVELVGGGCVLLGLVTPVAAAALLGVLIDALWPAGGLTFRSGEPSFELELLLAGLAAALALTGGGRLALDRRLPRFSRPHRTAVPCLLLAVGVAALFRFLAAR